jgi:hypothetical protein
MSYTYTRPDTADPAFKWKVSALPFLRNIRQLFVSNTTGERNNNM